MNPGVQTNMKINPLGLSFALAALLASTAAFGASAEEQAKTRRLKAAADHVLAGSVAIAITPITARPAAASGNAPSRPNSDGRYTEKPASRTQRAKRATCGLIPGISASTITAGPAPATRTVRVSPSSQALAMRWASANFASPQTVSTLLRANWCSRISTS